MPAFDHKKKSSPRAMSAASGRSAFKKGRSSQTTRAPRQPLNSTREEGGRAQCAKRTAGAPKGAPALPRGRAPAPKAQKEQGTKGIKRAGKTPPSLGEGAGGSRDTLPAAVSASQTGGMAWADALGLGTKSRIRHDKKAFLVERTEVLTQVLAQKWTVLQIFVEAPERVADIKALFDTHAQPYPPIAVLSSRRYRRLLYRKKADVVGVVRSPAPDLNTFGRVRASGLFFVLNDIEKPGNIGAIVRSAAAVAANAVISLSSQPTDWFNPNVIRNSAGACFALPLIDSTQEAFFEWAKQGAIQCLASVPEGERSYWEVDYAKPTAVLLGNEHAGLSAALVKRADARIGIPMHKAVNSLNVADVATLIGYEARRKQGWIPQQADVGAIKTSGA